MILITIEMNNVSEDFGSNIEDMRWIQTYAEKLAPELKKMFAESFDQHPTLKMKVEKK